MMSARRERMIEPVVIEPNGKPDLIIRCDENNRPKMARISGRNGRLVWEAPLVDDATVSLQNGAPILFDEVNGDGVLDALFVKTQTSSSDSTECVLRVISLRDGKQIWSQPVGLIGEHQGFGDFCAGDLDGDALPEVVVLEARGDRGQGNEAVQVRALDGRDGKTRWTWKSGVATQSIVGEASVALVDLDGDVAREVCVGFCISEERDTKGGVVVLEGNGKERTRRGLNSALRGGLRGIDLDGDGRDELLFVNSDLSSGQVHAWRGDLKNLWRWPEGSDTTGLLWMNTRELEPRREVSVGIDRIIPSPGKRRAAVLITTNLAGIDGSSGKPLWTGQQALVTQWPQVEPRLLDAGDISRRALTVASGSGSDVAVCRATVPLMERGRNAVISGRLAKGGGVFDDPRWTRPLPWLPWCTRILRTRLSVVFPGLACVNLILPGMILWLLFGRRRAFRMWALMVAPAVVAIPLLCYLNLAPWLPVSNEKWLSTGNRVFVTGTVAGVPVVFGAIAVVAALLRRRWRAIGAMGGIVVVATMLVAGGWVWVDRKSMAVGFEYYGWEGWGLVFLVGAYVAAVVWGVGRVILGMRGWVRRRGRGVVRGERERE